MRALFINTVCGIGSTGRICNDLADKLTDDGYECKIAYGRGVPRAGRNGDYSIRIGDDLDMYSHVLRARLLDDQGRGSKTATRKFLRWADNFKPDLLWLHNIHGYYVNYEMLFEWIKKRPEMQVKWTLHDCWAFTGHCTHFTMVGCEKWKNGCSKCPQKGAYPQSLFLDHSAGNYQRKKKAFIGVENLTLITPSQWLAGLTRESILQPYPVSVVNNTIDTTVFKPTPNGFKKHYGIKDKIMILGVASGWGPRKGYNDFFELSKRISNKCVIVMVGVTDKQIKTLPGNVIGIEHTNSPEALAEIYTAADVFFNPTYEDNYPTVNLEAEACGTPVITYDVGGCKETIHRTDSVAIEVGELDAAMTSISNVHCKE